MKNILLLLLVSISGAAFGQSFPQPVFGSAPDSVIRVYQAPANHSTRPSPAVFLNGKLAGAGILDDIEADFIESFNVQKETIEIDGIKYGGKIMVTTKPSYQPNAVTLTALKDKYTDLSGKPALFLIDGKLIQADYARYWVDEKAVSSIYVDKLRQESEGVDIALIKIVTKKGKSDEKFYIRGASR